jgi:hypothetical protein
MQRLQWLPTDHRNTSKLCVVMIVLLQNLTELCTADRQLGVTPTSWCKGQLGITLSTVCSQSLDRLSETSFQHTGT